MPKDDLEARFRRHVAEHALLTPGEVVAAAVSGGADSVAMLHLLAALARDEQWQNPLRVIHVNHNLRGEASQRDADFVRELARSLQIDCTVESVDVRQRAEEQGLSIETAARDCRFERYERFCLKHEVRALALAHQAEDQAETILHRIVRGTGLRGLSGIRPKRPLRAGSSIRVIHPILNFRRTEIEKFLADRGWAFCRDETNESRAYTRNRIRHEVMPLLRDAFNPQVTEALIRLGDQARGVDDYLTETGTRMLESLVVDQDDLQLVLHAPSLSRKPRVIQMQLVRQALLRLGVGEGDLTYGHFNAVVDLAADQAGSKALDLPSGLRVRRVYSRLVFERAAPVAGDLTPAAEVRVATEGTTLLPVRGIEINADVFPADEKIIADHIHRRTAGQRTSYEEWIDADRVHPPLIGRSRRPGDRFFPLGMNGMKKVSDFFIDEKIDAGERERTVVLCDQLGPIWIIPFRIDERVRLSRATRHVLRLQARPVGKPAS